MPPETEAGGPPLKDRHAPHATYLARVPELEDVLLAAAELADDLAGQRRREQDAYRQGYRDGFSSGEVVGAQRAEREIVSEWQHVADHVRGIAGLPPHAELELRRAAPGGDAYFAALVRNGGTEFAGVGRPRVPAPRGAYEQALEWARHRSGRAA